MFYKINNLSAAVAQELPAPWQYSASKIPESLVDKNAFKAWCVAPSTQHCFISAVEGLQSNLRASYEGQNPPLKVHALVVDYDAPLSMSNVEIFKSRPPAEFKPTHVVRTFSGNARLVWQFERPLLLCSEEQYKKLMVLIVSKLKLRKWLAGFEPESLADPCHFYEIGREWCEVSPDSRIPSNLLELWIIEASKKIKLSKDVDYTVPLEAVEAEMHKRFPNRWLGPFEYYSRGVRFWDPTASDPTGAVVMPNGMMAFSGEQAFIPWSKIFGLSWVEKFEADKIAKVVDNYVYDGSDFWEKDPARGTWRCIKTEMFTRILKKAGFDSHTPRGATISEVDKIICEVADRRRVTRAMPFLYWPKDIVTWNNRLFLNTSHINLMKPGAAEGVVTWDHVKAKCPFIHQWLENLFIDRTLPNAKDQLEYFLSWFAFFYQQAYKEDPQPGHALVLCGPANTGKTLLGRLLIGRIMGGFTDAASVLLDNNRFTEHVAEAPLWGLDDDNASSERRDLVKFTVMIKKLVANGTFTFDAKFKKAGDAPFQGRIMITLNGDGNSLRLLPDMDMSTADKISLLRVSDKLTVFPSRADVEATINHEAPAFARFLLDYQIPEERRVTSRGSQERFGVRKFQHPSLLQTALTQGHAGLVLDVLNQFLITYKLNNKDLANKEVSCWTGTTTQLYEALHQNGQASLRGLSPQGLSVALKVLSSRGFNLEETDYMYGLKQWRICTNLSGTEEQKG